MASDKSPHAELGVRRMVMNKLPRTPTRDEERELRKITKWKIYRIEGDIVEAYGSKFNVLKILPEITWTKLEKVVDGQIRWIEINHLGLKI